VVIGVSLVGLGVWILTGRQLTLLLPKLSRGTPTAKLGSMFGYGLAYAIASLSCTIGSLLVVTTVTFRDGSVLDGVLAYLAYGLGMTLVVEVLATAVALASPTVTTAARRLLPHIHRAGDELRVLVGLYVGYYGVYELRLYFGDGNASDPVIEAAGGIQQLLASWVDTTGVLPLLAALAVLVSGAVVLGRRGIRKHRIAPRMAASNINDRA
jgi:cytochrome c-type biogenesis protein